MYDRIVVARQLSVCRVEWDGVQWIVHCDGDSLPWPTYVNRDDAIWAARQRADRLRPSLLRVYRQDGALVSEFTYR